MGRRLIYGTIVSLLVAIGILAFYIYHEGIWKEIFTYYRFFFDPRNLKQFILSYGNFAPIVFVLVQALQVVFAPIPGEVTGFVGGLLFGTIKGTLLSSLGLTLGSLLAFFLSRWLGMRFVEGVVKREYVDAFNNFISHKGLGLAFVLYLIPGFPKDSLCYLLGLTHIRVIDFILMNAVGRLPGTLMLSVQGNAFGHAEYKTLFVVTILTIIVVFLLYFFREYLSRLIGYPVHLITRRKKHQESQ